MLSIGIRIALLCMVLSSTAFAQSKDYPARPLRIVTATPGGGNDFLARIIAPALGSALGQQVIVENRTSRFVGGLVARATPDGYTLAIGGGTMQYNPLMEESDYNILTDFAAISQLERAPQVLVVPPGLKVNTVQELIALAKAKPLRYGTSSAGGTAHLSGELFMEATGVKIMRVPYKSTGPRLIALMANEVQMSFSSTGGSIPHVKDGRLKALGVTSATPFVLLPNVPTLASQGLTNFDIDTIGFILAPLKTPPRIVRHSRPGAPGGIGGCAFRLCWNANHAPDRPAHPACLGAVESVSSFGSRQIEEQGRFQMLGAGRWAPVPRPSASSSRATSPRAARA
jgi:tripartite-type tricarboxylate transporter receptor subunit TctC